MPRPRPRTACRGGSLALLVLLGAVIAAPAEANYRAPRSSLGMTSIAGQSGTVVLMDHDATGPFSAATGVLTTLPFDMVFFGQTYLAGSPITVFGNGQLAFGDQRATGTGFQSVPSPALPNAIISAGDQTLESQTGGQCLLRVVSPALDRTLTIEWRELKVGPASRPTRINVQLVLHEHGAIEIKLPFDSAERDGYTGRIYVENEDGTEGLQVSRTPAEFNTAFIPNGQSDFAGQDISTPVTHANPGDPIVVEAWPAVLPVLPPAMAQHEIVISGDSVIDAGDPVLFQGGAITRFTSVVIPSLPAGEYTLGVRLDTGGQIPEAIEDNNTIRGRRTIHIGTARYQAEPFAKGLLPSLVGAPGATVHWDRDTLTPAPQALSISDPVNVTLPFDMEAFGIIFRELTLTPWGVIYPGGLDPAAGVDVADNVALLEAVGGREAVIAHTWAPLRMLDSDDVVLSMTEGAVGSRRFIYEFRMTNSGSGNNFEKVVGQIVFYEATKAIELRVADPAVTPGLKAKNFTFGIQNRGQTEAYSVDDISNSRSGQPSASLRLTPRTPPLGDLELRDIEIIQTRVRPGRPLEVRAELLCRGPAPQGPVEIELRAATTPPVARTDELFGTLTVPAMAAGERRVVRLPFPVPAGAPAGSRVLVAFLDPNDAIPEFDETNNAAASSRMVTLNATAYAPTPLPAGLTSIAGAPGAVDEQMTSRAPGSDGSFVLPLPFPFRFFGNTQSSIRVSRRGIATFDMAITDRRLGDPLALTATGGPTTIIAPLWGDLFDSGNATLHSLVSGAPGSRVYTLEWSDWSAVTLSTLVSFQIRLFEGTNAIELIQPDPATVTFPGFEGFPHVSGIARGGVAYGLEFLDPDGSPATRSMRFEPFQPAGPELVGGFAIASPAVAEPGSSVQLEASFRNIGPAASTPTDWQAVLATRSLPALGDPVLASFALPAMAPGQQVTVSGLVTIPAGVAAGPLILGAVADGSGILNEQVTGDNASSGAAVFIGTPPAPDLAITAVTPSSVSLRPSDPISATVTVTNIGTAPVNFHQVSLQLSDDTRIDAADALLGSSTGPLLTPGQSARVQVTGALPPGLAPGPAFLGATADATSQVDELREDNNVFTPTAIQIQPADIADIRPGPVTASAVLVAPGDVLDVTSTLENIGAQPFAGTVQILISLSRDPVFAGAPDEVVASPVLAPTIAPGASLSTTTTVTIPAGIAEGPWFLGIRALPLQNDGFTGNNAHGLTPDQPPPALITIAGPSAMITELALTAPPTTARRVAAPGELLSFGGAEVANLGTVAVTDVVIALTLSPTDGLRDIDRRLDPAQATILRRQSLPALAAGARAVLPSRTVVIPSLPPGAYHLGAIVDEPDALLEADEDNNRRIGLAGSLHVTRAPVGTDLTFPQLAPEPRAVPPGSSVSLTRIVGNLSRNPVAPFAGRLLLSDDVIPDAGDTLLEDITFPQGLSGLSPPAELSIAVPAGRPLGNLFVIGLVDEVNQIVESDETNNQVLAVIRVTTGPPCDVTLDGQVDVGDVQQVINTALGLTAGSGLEDLAADGLVNVADVQAVINVALGGPCP